MWYIFQEAFFFKRTTENRLPDKRPAGGFA